MKSLKKQMAVISVLMVLIIAALTLGGLQLFGKGKVKPSEWFKSNVAQAEQTAPERAATFTRGALLADNDGISMYSSDYEFELSLNGKTLSADWVSFNNVGWVWLLCYCEGVKSDYWGVMSGINHKDITLNMSSTSFSYDLNTLISAGKISEGVTYSFALYGSSNDGSMMQGSSVVTFMYRTPVPLPATPVKEGHTFAGWYYGTQAEHGSNCRAYDNAPIYSDTSLHAHFNINTFTVTFNSNGGENVASQTVNWNTSATTVTPERVGYRFLGWYLSDDNLYTNQPIKSDTVLAAHWEVITYTVAFYVDGEVYKTVTVEYGATLENVVNRANMSYYNLFSESGVKLSSASVVSEDIVINAVEMTTKEKAVKFFQKYWWIIALALCGIVLVCVTFVSILRKR